MAGWQWPAARADERRPQRFGAAFDVAPSRRGIARRRCERCRPFASTPPLSHTAQRLTTCPTHVRDRRRARQRSQRAARGVSSVRAQTSVRWGKLVGMGAAGVGANGRQREPIGGDRSAARLRDVAPSRREIRTPACLIVCRAEPARSVGFSPRTRHITQRAVRLRADGASLAVRARR